MKKKNVAIAKIFFLLFAYGDKASQSATLWPYILFLLQLFRFSRGQCSFSLLFGATGHWAAPGGWTSLPLCELRTISQLSVSSEYHNLERFAGCSVDARSTTYRTVSHHKYGKKHFFFFFWLSRRMRLQPKRRIFLAKSIEGRHALATSYFSHETHAKTAKISRSHRGTPSHQATSSN